MEEFGKLVINSFVLCMDVTILWSAALLKSGPALVAVGGQIIAETEAKDLETHV